MNTWKLSPIPDGYSLIFTGRSFSAKADVHSKIRVVALVGAEIGRWEEGVEWGTFPPNSQTSRKFSHTIVVLNSSFLCSFSPWAAWTYVSAMVRCNVGSVFRPAGMPKIRPPPSHRQSMARKLRNFSPRQKLCSDTAGCTPSHAFHILRKYEMFSR